MDNLTHTLTGLMLSRAGLDKLTPAATAILLLSANVPDIDIVTLVGGQSLYFHHHRGITHALVSLPAMAALPVALVRFVTRKSIPWRGALIASSAGVASHLLLDWLNHYGVRLLLPWSDIFYDLGVTFVADAWIWLLLLFGALWPLFSRLVSSEIGARPARGSGLARVVLAAMLLYNAARIAPWRRAMEMQEAHIYGGAAARRAVAIPHPVNPFLWTGVVDTGAALQVHSINLLRPFDPAAGQVLLQAESSSAIEAARRTQPFADLITFTDFGLWRETPDGGRVRVELFDLRFGLPGAPRFFATALVDAGGSVIESRFEH